MTKILIVQPTIPIYRIDLFNRIHSNINKADLVVVATHKDHTNVISNTTGANFKHILTGKVRKILFLHLQPGIWPFISSLKSGDTLVISGNPYFLITMLYAFLAKNRGVEVIWWGQLWSENTTKRSLRMKLGFMKLLSTKILLYTHSEAIMLTRLDISKKVYYLNNGINNQNIIEYRKTYNSYDRPDRMLFLGRITPKSNFMLLIKALVQCPDIHLDVIGSNFDNEQIIVILNTYKLDSRVTFHGLITDEKQIASVANSCLFFVYPGAVGLSVIHAFNYGLPALLHDNRRRHMPEIAAFKEGYNGETYIYNDSDSLAEKIRYLITNKDRLNTLSKGAIKTSANDYNTAIMADRFIHCIES